MKEIRLHGRGGQGVVTAATLLAHAAFEDGKISQAFPSFGSERTGAPVFAFVRISDEKIRSREEVRNPNYLIVQDPTLLAVIDVFQGLKPGGIVIINTEKKPEELNVSADARLMTVPALQIAIDTIGRPIPNTTMLGAFAGATGEVTIESVKKCVKAHFPGKTGELNAEAAEKAYRYMQGEKR